MRNLFKKMRDQLFGDPNLDCGLFSKREAARFLADGRRHIHSTMMGPRDHFAQVTKTALDEKQTPTYPWEQLGEVETLIIDDSKKRSEVIEKILSHPIISKKRFLRERVATVLEEMITNAIYHPYFQSDNVTSKYPRKEHAKLSENEIIEVSFGVTADGVFLSVSDKGGSLISDNITSCFHRCYEEGGEQIESKESGAGLGLYMIFELVSHLKVSVLPRVNTTVSCWIADRRKFDPDNFSVNLFLGSKNDDRE